MNFRHIKYLRVLSKILLFVFFVEPVLFSLTVQPVRAQNSGVTSSNYDKAFSSYDGISQWGNAALTSSPAIGSALKSCLNVVPTFTKKIKRLFSSGKLDASASSSLKTGGSQTGVPICLSRTPQQKFQEGLLWGDMTEGYGVDQKQCEEAVDKTIGVTQSTINLAANIDSIDVKDQQAISELERIRKAQEVTQQKLNDTNAGISTTNKKLDENQVRDNCMDSIAYSMTKTLLAGITEGTVNLINTGNFGDPFFIKDTKNYFEDIKKTSLKQVFGGLLEELNAIGQSQYPYLKSTYINLVAQNVPAEFRDRTRFTLEQALSGQPYDRASDPGVYSTPQASGQGSLVNMFKNDFSVGGWRGWLALTQQPQNNPIGFGLLAQEEFEKKQTSAAEQAKNELQQSGGFLSMRKCVEQRVPKSETDSRGFKVFTGEYDIKTRGITVKPDDPDCVKSEVVTPGSVLASRLDAVITSDVHQLELADQFNESLNLIFTAAFNKLTSEGLSALSSKVYGSWASQATKQSFVERYNNAINQGTNTTSSTLGTAELIYRRPQSSYSSADFDITTDLFDQQVGCQIRPGILTIEKRYLHELKNSNNKNLSPIYKLMPAMAELDYCIPGPTTNWEEIADEKYSNLSNGIAKEGITFVGSSEVPLSTYAEVGTQIGNLVLKEQRRDTTSRGIATGLGAASAAGGIAVSLLVAAGAASATVVGVIVGAVLVVGAVGAFIYESAVKKRQSHADSKLNAVLSRAPGTLQDAINKVFTDEAFTWGETQLELLRDDYWHFKRAVYKKFSDANSIEVATVARPFVQDLSSYASNIIDIQEGYADEIKTQEEVVERVQIIADQVKKINEAATARARAEEKAKGLPVGSLTEVPKACLPTANQCPAPLQIGNHLIPNTPLGLAPYGSNTAYATNSRVSPYSSRNSVNTPVGQAPGPGSFVGPGGPSIPFDDPIAQISNFRIESNGSYFHLKFDVISNPTTLSIKAKIPFLWNDDQEIYGIRNFSSEEYTPQYGVDYKIGFGYTVVQSFIGRTITLNGHNPAGKISTYSCTIRKKSDVTYTCE